MDLILAATHMEAEAVLLGVEQEDWAVVRRGLVLASRASQAWFGDRQLSRLTQVIHTMQSVVGGNSLARTSALVGALCLWRFSAELGLLPSPTLSGAPAVLVVNGSADVLYADELAAHLLGYASATLMIGLNALCDLVPTWELPRGTARALEIIRGQSDELSYRYFFLKRADQQFVLVEQTYHHLVLDEVHGTPTGWVMWMRPIWTPADGLSTVLPGIMPAKAA